MDRAPEPLSRISRRADAQGHEARVRSARLHWLHVLLFSVSRDRAWRPNRFRGPSPLVQLAQTALDPRNSPAKVARALAISGIFNCVSCYKCEEVCPAKIPIVTHVIEPLKRMSVELVPEIARHPRAFLAIVAARGRIDPSELVLRVQGVRALARIGRIVRLLLRGKINPLKTFLGTKSNAAATVARILGTIEWRQP